MVKAAWRYWSGILHDHEMRPRFGLMHAVFESPDVPLFAHTSIVDLVLKTVYAGDHEMLAISIPELPIPASPRIVTATGDERHESDSIGVGDVTLTIGGDVYSRLNGVLWYDAETRPAMEGSGWRWISMRLFDGRNVMLYQRSDAPPRYAVRTGGEWESLTDADINALEMGAYESKWRVRIGGETFIVAPVVPNQEIVDVARNISYLEALCDVFDSFGTCVGSAYVEILPARKAMTRPIISKPSELEMHRRWAREDGEAAALIDAFGYATQLADDLVDLDRDGVKSIVGRSHVMAEVIYTLLITIPGNPFFRKNELHFVPLFTNCLVQWDASNAWAESAKKETRMFAYVQREATARLIEYVAYLVGGFAWSKQVAREVHDYYHGANGVEGFDVWESERRNQ